MEHGKNSFSESYAKAGVDITAGYKAVELMKSSIARTATDGAIGNIGNFGGLFMPDLAGIKIPYSYRAQTALVPNFKLQSC